MPGKATFVSFSAKLIWPHFEVVHWFALNFIKNIYFVICFFYYVYVTYCMRVQCYLCTNPIPSGIPLPGRTAHRTAGISMGSAGPRPNIKGNTPNSGIKPEGSHTQKRYDSSEPVISSSQKSLPTLHTTYTRDEHLYCLRDSNPCPVHTMKECRRNSSTHS